MTPMMQAPSTLPAPVATWQGLIIAGVMFLLGNVAVTTFVALAVFDKLILRRLRSDDNTSSVDDIVIDAIQRREAEVAAVVHRVTKPAFDSLEARYAVAQTNSDRLETVESIQGINITRITRLEEQTRDMPRMVDALERIEHAMEGISRGMSETRDMVHTMKGEWNSEMRRRSTDR